VGPIFPDQVKMEVKNEKYAIYYRKYKKTTKKLKTTELFL
jgi:hypothetical protein